MIPTMDDEQYLSEAETEIYDYDDDYDFYDYHNLYADDLYHLTDYDWLLSS